MLDKLCFASRKYFPMKVEPHSGKTELVTQWKISTLYTWGAHTLMLDKCLPTWFLFSPSTRIKPHSSHICIQPQLFVKGTAWKPIKNTLLLWVFCSSLLYNKLQTTVGEHSMGRTAVLFIDVMATQTNRKCIFYHTGEPNHIALNRMEYFPYI